MDSEAGVTFLCMEGATGMLPMLPWMNTTHTHTTIHEVRRPSLNRDNIEEQRKTQCQTHTGANMHICIHTYTETHTVTHRDTHKHHDKVHKILFFSTFV